MERDHRKPIVPPAPRVRGPVPKYELETVLPFVADDSTGGEYGSRPPKEASKRRPSKRSGRNRPPGKEHTLMEVLVVLLVSLNLLRGVGLFGIKRLSTWRNAGLGALAIMFLVTSTAHFNSMKHDLAAMMPEPLPDELWIIYLTGIFEIAGAIGLLIPRTRKLAGIGLVLMLIAMFPANVYAALNGIPLGGEPPTPLWLRTPMQFLFIGMVWWAAIRVRPKEIGRLLTGSSGVGTRGPVRAGDESGGNTETPGKGDQRSVAR
jgi:uncharacterized membrane protein